MNNKLLERIPLLTLLFGGLLNQHSREQPSYADSGYLKVGRKKQKTKRQIELSKLDSISRHTLRREALLKHQEKSYSVLEVSTKYKKPPMSNATKRNIKMGILGKKGGLPV